MQFKQQSCVISTEEQTRRVFVDLWANETLLQRRRLVLEAPSDCTEEGLKELGGCALDSLANAEQVDCYYETEEPDDFEVLKTITVESGVPDHLESDLVLTRDNVHLVLTEN